MHAVANHPRCVICRADRVKRLSGSVCEQAWLCSRCGHTFVGAAPPRHELTELYDFYGYDGREEAWPAFLREILGSLVDSFAPYRTKGRLLDVGFGAGLLLREARGRGWDTEGVELSRAAVERGRVAKLGQLHLGDFLRAPLEPRSFDVVVMAELIEHLPEPMPFLRRAAEVLRPGGLLYMTTPHGRGLSGRILGADWSVLKPPEHLHLFSVDSARRCVADAGFSSADVYTQSVLPHEIAAKLREKLPRSAVAGISSDSPRRIGDERVARSYRLNGLLMRNGFGRAVKTATNGVLRAVALGDSLRIKAER